MKKENLVKRSEDMHPYQMLVYLAMGSSGLIFIFLTLPFILSVLSAGPVHLTKLPVFFWISTVVLLAGSMSAHWLINILRHGKLPELQQVLYILLGTCVLFVTFQFCGWCELGMEGIYRSGLPTSSYLYLLTGIHVLHILGLMLFLSKLIVDVHQVRKDPIKELIFETNPYVIMKFRLFKHILLFVDIVWIVFFLLFMLAFG
ncbi:cytochrome C oxidase subunit III [Echinicola pacifica]|uniref:cytochrome C oxidase subunit III n=1 Tax=Echinicola pacifica TaxID=346377 RepID=UPI0012F8D20C|nr:cytochrome C oxidase subunit III [Echinicola pacifica]